MKKNASAVAYGPGKTIFMVLIMSWMTGNNLNIFTIIMTFSMLIQPVTSMLNLDKRKNFLFSLIIKKNFRNLKEKE